MGVSADRAACFTGVKVWRAEAAGFIFNRQQYQTCRMGLGSTRSSATQPDQNEPVKSMKYLHFVRVKLRWVMRMHVEMVSRKRVAARVVAPRATCSRWPATRLAVWQTTCVGTIANYNTKKNKNIFTVCSIQSRAIDSKVELEFSTTAVQ